MSTNELIQETRRTLGPVGAFLPNIPFSPATPVELQRSAVRRLEAAGYPTAWVNEGVGGKDALVQAAVLLASTDRIVVGTAVSSIWARPPETLHGASTLLADAFPGRFILGVGVGYPEQATAVGRDFGRPLATVRDYMERMDAPQDMTPAPDVAYPRILAANGPKMLGLAGEITDGALPSLVPAEYTRRAREMLGPDKLLVMGLSVAYDEDRDQARAVARDFASAVIARPGSPYAVNLARLGYSAEELASASDRVVDAVLGHGNDSDIAAKVQEHLDAGADHVRVATITADFATGIDQLERLGPALVDGTSLRA